MVSMNNNPTNILVIDDRSDIRLTLSMLLEDHNYQVIEADSPQIAQLLIKKNDISLILNAYSNLGGDAALIVPCPREPLSAYSQISTFARGAPDDQQHQLWVLVAEALKRRLGDRPVWVSTSGLGIYWLHIRLDSTPKYYTHEPFRALK